MLTKTKLALAVVLVLSTSSAVLAAPRHTAYQDRKRGLHSGASPERRMNTSAMHVTCPGRICGTIRRWNQCTSHDSPNWVRGGRSEVLLPRCTAVRVARGLRNR